MNAVAEPRWSEAMIARAIARQTLASKCIVLVDNCNWTGNECDLLAVTNDLRLIDVEVKISRADLKADGKKDKWWRREGWLYAERRWAVEERRTWPPRIWKHYYAMPREIWTPALADFISPASGVLLMGRPNSLGAFPVYSERRCKPNRDAGRLTPEQAVDIARLANLRMWDAYARLHKWGAA